MCFILIASPVLLTSREKSKVRYTEENDLRGGVFFYVFIRFLFLREIFYISDTRPTDSLSNVQQLLLKGFSLRLFCAIGFVPQRHTRKRVQKKKKTHYSFCSRQQIISECVINVISSIPPSYISNKHIIKKL